MKRSSHDTAALRVLRLELQLISEAAESWTRNLAALSRRYTASERRSVTARIARYRAEADNLARAIAILEASHV
jgi:hypothetical protein